MATCGGDLDGFANALGQGLTVVANLCLPPGNRSVRATGECEGTVFVGTQVSNGTATDVRVRSAVLDVRNPNPTLQNVASVMVTPPAGASLFASSHVAPNADGTRVTSGYTRSTDFGGDLFILDTAGGAAVTVNAPGNYDAAWLDGTLLVNGTGLGALESGQGIYAVQADGTGVRRVLANQGDASGAVAVLPDWVLAGAYGGDFPVASGNNLVFAVPRARLVSALTGSALDAQLDQDIVKLQMPSDFEWLGEGTLVTFNYATMVLDAYTLQFSVAGAPSLSAASRFADGTVFFAVHRLGDGHALLSHADGALVVALP